MHKSGSGATTEHCCFNGSDLLLLRPVWKSWAAASAAATEWTQYPDSRSHGPQASGPPPACPPCCHCSFQSFIFLATAMEASPFNANQCHTEKMPHTEPVTEPKRPDQCVYSKKQKIRLTSPLYFLHYRSIDTSMIWLYFLIPDTQTTQCTASLHCSAMSSKSWQNNQMKQDSLSSGSEFTHTLKLVFLLNITMEALQVWSTPPCQVPLSSSLKTLH